MGKKTLLSWSSGKDSAWALHMLQQEPEYDLAGLFTTVNEEFDRVAMHAVRLELLQRQADRVGLPLEVIKIPNSCSNRDYESIMNKFVSRAKTLGVECFAFGDLFLEDIRCYRESRLHGSGITPVFPLWGMPTSHLANEMLCSGLRAQITCVDPRQLSANFAGREFDNEFLRSLPEGADPCGENGEFHSFVFDGPMFVSPVAVQTGETVNRDGFVFTDLLPLDD